MTDICLVCSRPRTEHDTGLGLATCRGIAVPSFRSRRAFEAEVWREAVEAAADVCRCDECHDAIRTLSPPEDRT